MVKIIPKRTILVAFMFSILSILFIPSTNFIIYSKTKENNNININPSSSQSPKIIVDTQSTETSQINQPVTIRKDSSGDLKIIGEIANKGTETAKFMEIIATIYNAQNQTIGKENVFTSPNSIEPGQSAPFEMTLGSFNDIPVDQIDHIKLHIEWRDTNHLGI